MKYFVVADVHGFYNAMKRALNQAGFDQSNPEHIFVSLGDAFDRGELPRQVLQFFMNLPADRRILIRGNHEDLMERAISRQFFYDADLTNGTQNTTFLLTGKRNTIDALIDMRRDALYNEYIANCVDYYETQHCIFVHGWIPHNSYTKGLLNSYKRHDYIADWRNASREKWEEARWYNGMESWADGVRESDKTIFCGHWYTAWAREVIDKSCSHNTIDHKDFVTWEREGIVALDACTALTRFVNCYVVEDEPLVNNK